MFMYRDLLSDAKTSKNVGKKNLREDTMTTQNNTEAPHVPFDNPSTEEYWNRPCRHGKYPYPDENVFLVTGGKFMHGQGQTPLGRNQSYTSQPASKAEQEERGRESFHNIKASLLEMSKEQRSQLYGFNLVHLREFIDDYQEYKKLNPKASSEELFSGAVEMCKSNSNFDVEKELRDSKESFWKKTGKKACAFALSCIPGSPEKESIHLDDTPDEAFEKVTESIFEPNEFIKDGGEEALDDVKEKEEDLEREKKSGEARDGLKKADIHKASAVKHEALTLYQQLLVPPSLAQEESRSETTSSQMAKPATPVTDKTKKAVAQAKRIPDSKSKNAQEDRRRNVQVLSLSSLGNSIADKRKSTVATIADAKRAGMKT